MISSVKLQNPFSYSLLLLIVFALIVIVPPIIILTVKIIRMNKGKVINKRVNKKVITQSDIEKMRLAYVARIDEVEKKSRDNDIEKREAFIELSATVREFVQNVTGISTSNYTLSEIKKVSLPELYVLIEKYYEPEFGLSVDYDSIKDPFSDARKVIKEWN